MKLLTDGTYRTAGRLVALSLTQGGPGLHCMAEAVYRYWCGLPVTDDLLDVDMISDVDMKAKFQLVAEAANDAAFHVAVNDISDIP